MTGDRHAPAEATAGRMHPCVCSTQCKCLAPWGLQQRPCLAPQKPFFLLELSRTPKLQVGYHGSSRVAWVSTGRWLQPVHPAICRDKDRKGVGGSVLLRPDPQRALGGPPPEPWRAPLRGQCWGRRGRGVGGASYLTLNNCSRQSKRGLITELVSTSNLGSAAP